MMVVSIQILYKTILNKSLTPQQLVQGEFIPKQVAIVTFISVTIIYAISYFTEKDNRYPLDKIKSLKIPEILKMFSK
jgi:hypothetical protein